MLLLTQEVKIGFLDSLLVFVIGFAVIAIVLGILIGIIQLVRLAFMIKFKKKESKTEQVALTDQPQVSDEEDEELVAVITAAIMAYYSQESDVVVPFRIRKIHR